jgi:hypothetical protein
MTLRAAVNYLPPPPPKKKKFRKLIDGPLAIHFTEHQQEMRLLSQHIDKERIAFRV